MAVIPDNGPAIVLQREKGLVTIGAILLSTYCAKEFKLDLDCDGVKNRTGWAGSDDGFLVFDRNGDGVVNHLDDNWQHLKVWRDLNQDGII